MDHPEAYDTLLDLKVPALDSLARPVHFEMGQCLFREGEPADCFYYIDEGTVRTQLDREELDSEGVLRFVEPGAILGEVAVLDGQPRSASAYAETVVKARCVDLASLPGGRSAWTGCY